MNPVGNVLSTIFSRFGEEVPIKRFTEDGTDRLNQQTGNWKLVGNVMAVKYYPSENGQTSLASGTMDTDRPHLIFNVESDVEDGDKVYFPSGIYEIQSITLTHGYKLATVKRND